MKTRFHIARAGACLLLSASAFHAQAQTHQAADAQAAVPATLYQSALGTRAEASPSTTPDQNWVASNQLVAATNSMALTMKPMAGHAGHSMPAPQSADPHAGHAGHAGMQVMDMGKQDSPDMCTPGDAKAGGKGMQCMAGEGKMSCCQSGCCCKDKMDKADKPREAA